MITSVISAAEVGFEATELDIEVNTGSNLPIVVNFLGLLDAVVVEGSECHCS